MKTNIIGALEIYRTLNIKPNYSALAKEYGLDRKTVAKYWKEGGVPKRKKTRRRSKLDPLREEIENILSKPGVTLKGAHFYFCDKYGQESIGSYSNFRTWLKKNNIKTGKESKAHVRFENLPGEQMQVDWKQDIAFQFSDGRKTVFSVFSATLSYSRMHCFFYSAERSTEDFLRCLLDSIRKFGGMPKTVLTDNMPAVVSIQNGVKRKRKKIVLFEKDSGIRIQLCRKRAPETKGKDESANRFINWLMPYNGEVEDEYQLMELMEKITMNSNLEINGSTGKSRWICLNRKRNSSRKYPVGCMYMII